MHQEAAPAKQELVNQGTVLPPEVFEDSRSTNSIQNFRVLGSYLAGLLAARKAINLKIISSDYHLDRMEIVHNELEPQSPVNELPSVCRLDPASLWERCNYRATISDCGHATQFASIYVAAELLMPLRINLEGMLTGRLNRVVRSTLMGFQAGLTDIERHLPSSTKDLPDPLRDDMENVRALVTQLKGHHSRLKQIAGLVSASFDEDELRCLRNGVAAGIDRIRLICDPDQEKFDDYFPNRRLTYED